RVRLFYADRGFQPEQRLDEMRTAAVLEEIPLQTLPYVRVVGIVEPRRHHPAHRVDDGAERDRLADDGGIAVEPLAPETMADDRQAIARIEGGDREPRADEWLDPNDAEEVAARLDRVDPNRILPRLGDVHLRIPPARSVLEDM